MKSYTLLFVLITTTLIIHAQRAVLGSSPMMTDAEENQSNMRKLLRRSCRLPSTIADTTADTVLIKMVDTIHSERGVYSVLFDKDSTKAAIEIRKLYPGYKVITYRKSLYKKRISYFNSHYLLSQEYSEYFENGKVSVKGNYLNGKKCGIWTHYSLKGDRTYIEQYSQGVLLPLGK